MTQSNIHNHYDSFFLKNIITSEKVNKKYKNIFNSTNKIKCKIYFNKNLYILKTYFLFLWNEVFIFHHKIKITIIEIV